MSKNYLFAGALLLGCALLPQPSVAGPLTSAEVTKIINRVAVIDPAAGEHPAIVREVIKDDLGLQTGEKSRSELLFQDNTLTRLGAETFFSFKTGTRDMTLEKGSMLLQVPKGLGGAKIHTAAVTAAITGTTIMMEYIPGKYIKVLVLEGSLRLSRNGRFGDSLVLRPGKMVIMRPDAKKIPEPVDVDLKQIVKTSTLVNFPDAAPLPSMGLIDAAIDVQNKSIAKGDLAPTNLVMGHGTDVVVASNDQLAKIAALSPADVNGNGTAPGGTTLADVAPLPLVEPQNVSTEPLALPAPVAGSAASLPLADSITTNTTSIVASVTDTTSSLLGSVTSDTTSLLGSLTATTTSLVGAVANDTTAQLGSLTAPVTPVLGVLTETATSLLAPLTGSTASLPVLGLVTDTTASLLDSVTSNTASLPIVGSVTGSAASLVSSVTASTASLPVVGSVTANTTSLVVAVPVIGTVAQSNPVIPASTVNLGSSTGGGNTSINTLLAATQTTTSPTVPVSSSTQLLTILSNATSAGGGTIVVSPTNVSGTSVAGAPAVTSSSVPVSSTATTTTAPSTITSNNSGSTATVTTLTAVPTTLASGTTTTILSTATMKPALPLGLGR